jgi:ABC-type phosphate transport system ATPase subunit
MTFGHALTKNAVHILFGKNNTFPSSRPENCSFNIRNISGITPFKNLRKLIEKTVSRSVLTNIFIISDLEKGQLQFNATF